MKVVELHLTMAQSSIIDLKFLKKESGGKTLY